MTCILTLSGGTYWPHQKHEGKTKQSHYVRSPTMIPVLWILTSIDRCYFPFKSTGLPCLMHEKLDHVRLKLPR